MHGHFGTGAVLPPKHAPQNLLVLIENLYSEIMIDTTERDRGIDAMNMVTEIPCT